MAALAARCNLIRTAAKIRYRNRVDNFQRDKSPIKIVGDDSSRIIFATFLLSFD